jgi:hypothetical protein
MKRLLFLPLLGFAVLSCPLQGAEPPVDYVKDVKPILTRCFACHGAVRQRAKLRLDAIALIRKGGRNGSTIEPGMSGKSLLIAAVLGKDTPRMPPESEGAALTEQQIATLRAWIDQGAKAPDEPIPPDPREHWAFRPLTRPSLPTIRNPQSAIRNPIDLFLEAERQKQGLGANPQAGAGTLLRRVYLDLVGVPPSREELHAFVADTSAGAYERVVDRLLASPQYGERWGRHWMDVWRYSDPFGNGDELRYSQKHIWHWRDWIIESLNSDKGYDRMIQEMLAGDELAPADPKTLRATGYLARNWYKFNRTAWLQDTVEHTAQGFLGLTLRCARCHDHKYDPIAQTDYYRFRAFFEPHDIRIDALPGQRDTSKDGIPRAFDAKSDVPTYLFVRGDDRYPDKDRPLKPGVPSVVAGAEVDVMAVRPTPRDLALALDSAANAATAQARAEVENARYHLQTSEALLRSARETLEALRAKKEPAPPKPAWLSDSFAAARPETWKTIRGQWSYEGGKLVQKELIPWAMITTQQNAPRDLMARLRFKATGGKVYRSVGMSYDVIGDTSFQGVYMSAREGGVQAFHRIDRVEVYPGGRHRAGGAQAQPGSDARFRGARRPAQCVGQRPVEARLQAADATAEWHLRPVDGRCPGRVPRSPRGCPARERHAGGKPE